MGRASGLLSRTPSSNASGWYVFCSAAAVLLILQVVTGILLALIETPTANDVRGSLQLLNAASHSVVPARNAWLGLGLRGHRCLHSHDAGLALGASKVPRELLRLGRLCPSSVG